MKLTAVQKYLKRIGSLGGSKRTQRQTSARVMNAMKARKARQQKKGR